jgi:hypothetical protein
MESANSVIRPVNLALAKAPMNAKLVMEHYIYFKILVVLIVQ